MNRNIHSSVAVEDDWYGIFFGKYSLTLIVQSPTSEGDAVKVTIVV